MKHFEELQKKDLSIGLAGAIWSTAAGMVLAGAVFVVGMPYKAMAITVCDGL